MDIGHERECKKRGSEMKFVFWLALTLSSPHGERGQLLCAFGFAIAVRQIQRTSFSETETILLLLEEKAGMRESVTHYLNATESGGEHARTADASRGSETLGSREAFGLRVSLAPLSEGAMELDAPSSRREAISAAGAEYL